jgi:RNA polymerase sigma factor (sigma-70 family)
MSQPTSDEALVRASLRGDEDAFAQLVRRYMRKAMAVALVYMPTREDAEDVVQDTFARVYERLGSFDTMRSFGPWFFTVLRNTARNAVESRRIREHDALPESFASCEPGPYEQTRRLELRQRIDEAVGRLPAMQRTCFTLCLVEGLSAAEAAAAVGVAESTVRVHVFRARMALQQLLSAWRNESEE